MTQQFEDSVEMNPALALDPSATNPAILHCCEAWTRAYRTVFATGKSTDSAWSEARKAYRLALPTLTSPQNISDFIACVAHGVVLQVFLDTTSSKLLYAAQVAHTAQAGQSTRRKPTP